MLATFRPFPIILPSKRLTLYFRPTKSKAEAAKALPGGGKTATTGTAAAAAAEAAAGREAGGAHALLAALMASERYLAGLVDGTGRLWAACEAVS